MATGRAQRDPSQAREHDANNALQMIQGGVYALNQARGELTHGEIRELEQAMHLGMALLETFLDAAWRSDAPVVSLGDAVADAVDAAVALGAEVSAHLPGPVHVLADPADMGRVLRELVAAMSATQPLAVHVDDSSSHAVVTLEGGRSDRASLPSLRLRLVKTTTPVTG